MHKPNYGVPHSTLSRSPEDTAIMAERARLEAAALRPWRERLELLHEQSEAARSRSLAAQDTFLDVYHRTKDAETELGRRWPNGRPEKNSQDFDLAAAELSELRERRERASTRRDALSAQWRPLGSLHTRCAEWLEKNREHLVNEYVAQQQETPDGK